MSERNARRTPVIGLRVRSILDGLSKECDPRLVPEPLAEEKGRVRRYCERRRRGELRGVVSSNELSGIDAQVNLEGRVGSLQRYVVHADLEEIVSANADQRSASTCAFDAR